MLGDFSAGEFGTHGGRWREEKRKDKEKGEKGEEEEERAGEDRSGREKRHGRGETLGTLYIDVVSAEQSGMRAEQTKHQSIGRQRTEPRTRPRLVSLSPGHE